MRSATETLRTTRDLLIDHRESLQQAAHGFSWPDVGSTFNFAHDWFDPFARGNDRPGLTILEEDGSRTTRTFAELTERSDQVAAFLTSQGIGLGDRILIMLGNQVELWESMLAAVKLGAVIIPTTTAVGPTELTDRLSREEAKAVICNVADTAKFEQIDVPGVLMITPVTPRMICCSCTSRAERPSARNSLLTARCPTLSAI